MLWKHKFKLIFKENIVNTDLIGVIAVPLMDVRLLLSTAGQTVLAEGQSGTRAYGWYTLSLTVEVSGDSDK